MNRLLKVGLTQYCETVAIQMLATVGLFYFVICENPYE